MIDSTITVSEADEYFAARLYTAEWDAADDATKGKALAQAERDIRSINIAGTPPTLKIRFAICEQALYLLEKTPADRERARAQQAGVNSRGVGDAREDYNGNIQRISPDALQHLQGYVQRRLGSIR